MNFDLALKLRMAGFPEDKCSDSVYRLTFRDGHNIAEFIDCPTKEELLSECGLSFLSEEEAVNLWIENYEW